MNPSTFTPTKFIEGFTDAPQIMESAQCLPSPTGPAAASTPFEVLGPPVLLSPKMRALKRRILALIASHPDGIDSYDIAVTVGCSAITINAICQDLEREGKVTGA